MNPETETVLDAGDVLCDSLVMEWRDCSNGIADLYWYHWEEFADELFGGYDVDRHGDPDYQTWNRNVSRLEDHLMSMIEVVCGRVDRLSVDVEPVAMYDLHDPVAVTIRAY